MLSVNQLAVRICKRLMDSFDEFNVKHTCFSNGVHLIDTGNKVIGGIDAGVCVTEICLGGVGDVSLTSMDLDGLSLLAVEVSTDFPVLSLLCQASGGYREAMEGWINFKCGSYSAIASGPARAIVHEPKGLFKMLEYQDDGDVAVVVLQSEQYPDEKVATHFLKRCKVNPENLYLVLSPLSSMSGLVQVTGRTVENAMVKLKSLDYDPKKVRFAKGIAPLPPLGSRTTVPDDMLSYGSIVHLFVERDEKVDLAKLVQKLPSHTSRDYGKSFTQLISENKGLRGIDINLFAPAQVYVNDLGSGEFYRSGRVNGQLIRRMTGLKSSRAPGARRSRIDTKTA
jgi:methenyltetrahydromethanopterin cyclohydrolase